jgi:hypothetical protein
MQIVQMVVLVHEQQREHDTNHVCILLVLHEQIISEHLMIIQK